MYDRLTPLCHRKYDGNTDSRPVFVIESMTSLSYHTGGDLGVL
jgi:hypothetical protein